MPAWLEPLFLINTLGLLGVWGIIFAESSLFLGFFLPGDSLLFTAGFLAANHYFNFYTLVIGCTIAAILGDNVGYWFGAKVGPKIFTKEDSFFFKKSYLEKTQAYYDSYGAKTILIARFVPVVRTFAPILAGVGKMNYKVFLSYNIGGGIVWTLLFTGAGFTLGQLVPNSIDYLHWIVLGVIFVSLLPLGYEVLKARKII